MFVSDKSEYFHVSIIIGVFVLSRLLFLFFTPYAYYCEEAKIGSIGHDIVFEKRLRLPFWGYLDSPHAGGSIFSGLAAIPFYYIFGDKYLTLKITALFFSLVTVILWYRLLILEIGRKIETFIFFLLLFSFATPHYVQKSVILVGNTVELMFFNILIISYFWKVKKRHVTTPLSFFFLGILCGFSFWVQFMSFYLFLAIVLVLLITERFKVAIYQLFYISIGFLLGMLPLWIYNFQYKWATLTADARGGLHLLFDLEKFRNFLLIDIPASFHFLDIGRIKSHHLSYVVHGLFIITVFMYFWKKWKDYRENKRGIDLGSFLILYMSVFIFFTSFTSAPIRSNEAYGWNSMNVHAEYYIVSLSPVIFALFALLKSYRNLYFFINTIVGIVFILGYISLFQRPYYNTSLFSPMHSTGSNAYECGFNFIRNPELFLEFKHRVPNELQKEYIKGAKDACEQIPKKIRERIFRKYKSLSLCS